MSSPIRRCRPGARAEREPVELDRSRGRAESRPPRIRSSVVFPAPLRPVTETMSPGAIRGSSPSSVGVAAGPVLAHVPGGEQRVAGRRRTRLIATGKPRRSARRRSGAWRGHRSARRRIPQSARRRAARASEGGYRRAGGKRQRGPRLAADQLGGSWSAVAFGLAVGGPLRLDSLVAAPAAGPPDTRIERAPRAALDARWRAARPRRLLERHIAGGRVGLTVQYDDADGYRVGRHATASGSSPRTGAG